MFFVPFRITDKLSAQSNLQLSIHFSLPIRISLYTSASLYVVMETGMKYLSSTPFLEVDPVGETLDRRDSGSLRLRASFLSSAGAVGEFSSC